ncbi:hypothetical protein OESDEN_10299 [Oesophagostomum dentatum]|uniref:Uncharacterized protein n=1 Tax=Oesophagostomum dentatum TaxID=61180 RepID=A0A0B1SY04_OESDE|nr:hypothetical protein OESDEN_10299 [Oesophagostomum dentatum]
MFTSEQYIELLTSFLSASNNMPLVQQSPLHLVLLLRILLYLVQVLPCNRVLAEIARFFLRKGKDDEISPTEALAALDEWKRVFRTVDCFSKPERITCFESPRALCIALRIHYEYARASKKSDQWIKECGELFKLSGQCFAADDKAVILGAFLDVLESHWKTYHTHKDKLLESIGIGTKTLSLRWFNNPQEAGAMPKSDIVAEITRAEASKRRDPALWRLALAQTKSSRFLSETHVLASAQCGWSRHLHIDCIALLESTKKCKEIISLMEERGVHVFNDLDYIKVMKGDERMEE